MKKTELATVPERELAMLAAEFPVEAGFTRLQLPRLAMASQDVWEGKGKNKKVIIEAGTFYTENPTNEVDKDGKKIWAKEELGTSIEGIILFKRKQLRYFDSATETYTSSPIYDNDDEVIPLFKNKSEIDRGTPKELKSRAEYQKINDKGKTVSKLEDNKILYVLFNDEVYQLNLRGTSMYAYQKYEREVSPPTVVTRFDSESKANGSIAWNQMTFNIMRVITADELETVKNKLHEIKQSIADEKAFYSATSATTVEEQAVNKQFNDFQ